MSTPNFLRMKYNMPLLCGYLNYWQQKEKYEKEFDKDYTKDLYYWDVVEFANEAQKIAEDFTKSLKYHDVTIISGHYDGFQFYVDEIYGNYFDLDENSEFCIDNETAKDYWGLFRSQVLREAAAEKRKIRKWLEGLNGDHFKILVCTAVFSNGEAIYEERDNIRAQLKAACMEGRW